MTGPDRYPSEVCVLAPVLPLLGGQVARGGDDRECTVIRVVVSSSLREHAHVDRR